MKSKPADRITLCLITDINKVPKELNTLAIELGPGERSHFCGRSQLPLRPTLLAASADVVMTRLAYSSGFEWRGRHPAGGLADLDLPVAPMSDYVYVEVENASQTRESVSIVLSGVIRDMPGEKRSTLLPMNPAEIVPAPERGHILELPPHSSLTLSAIPGRLVRPLRLELSGDLTDIYVTDTRVGKNSQFAASGSVPAQVFAADNELGAFSDDCPNTMVMTVTLYNDSKLTKKLSGQIICEVLPTPKY